MRSRGDKYRRTSCYTRAARRNDEVARLVEKHYAELAPLIRDDMTADAFQDTYCRITLRPVQSDFVRQFKRLFYNTLREIIKKNRQQKNKITSYADYQQADKKATQADGVEDD